MGFDIDFYKGKRVLITGNTGFKGSWLCKILSEAGAVVTGYALDPPTNPSLFEIAGLGLKINSVIGDVRDFDLLSSTFNAFKPEIVFHLAAQPLVRESYVNPRNTYETNVMGTVNVLECIRNCPTVKSVVNVTTDKVYKNNEWEWGYRENDILNGYDPYSNSKSCSELVTDSYRKSFFDKTNISISTARAGNVIGGGDFAKDRIIPDCIKAAIAKETIAVRNPFSTRPYQYVLEPLFAYLLIAEKQYGNKTYEGSYNIGPEDFDCYQTGHLVDLFTKKWGEGLTWEDLSDNGPHEANFLKLDCSKMKSTFGWAPNWNLEKSIQMVIDWTKCWIASGDINECMRGQIMDYLLTY